MTTVDDVRTALGGMTVHGSEEELNLLVERLLGAAGIEFKREHPLSKRDRVDFLVGRLALELKVDGSAAAILRQLDRYAESPDVDDLVLVTTRHSHRFATTKLRGKPIHVICMGGI
jgi:hypothetical protein